MLPLQSREHRDAISLGWAWWIIEYCWAGFRAALHKLTGSSDNATILPVTNSVKALLAGIHRRLK